jgi:nucleotide-binding universal stress UspA family protein
MAGFERILCGVDFSEGSRHALDYALAMAHWYNATVTALHVAPPFMLAAGNESHIHPAPLMRPADDLDRIRLELALLVEQETGGPAIMSVVREGAVVGEILKFAESDRSDLVVVGTHGRSGFQRLILGSVTESLLRHAVCPVLITPPRMPDAVPLGPRIFRRILCAVDFSPCSRKALAYATSLADRADARLTLLHVAEPVADYVAVTVGGVDNVALRAGAERRLNDLVAGWSGSTARLSPMLRVGKPAPQILELADEQAIDLIVLGVTGRGAAGMIWFGSTTNQIVRRATCPVLTLRS